ncbi:hypothetical protein, partial [Bradyrhizobium sp. S3.9.1]|uniref:hypothetical protein n=1 Tax=Bradyrhizobium sp. S3.9.1 TaxID=3156431 RepID=UPI0033940604
IGDLRMSLTPHERGQPSAQDDLTRGRHRTRTLKLQTDGRFLRRSAATKQIQIRALLFFGAMNFRTIPRMHYP